MNRFVVNILLFTGLLISIITASLLAIPNKSVQNSLLGAITDKHTLMLKAGSPKIVFVGGSNLSFGLESRVISKHFKMPVVNTGLHAGLGLRYFASDVLPYINNGDIVVLCPEYQHFYNDIFYGDMELVAVLFDLFQDGQKLIDIKQWCHLIPFIPRYAVSKIKIQTPSKPKEGDIYARNSFNAYGDAYLHWNLPRIKIEQAVPCKENDVVNVESIAFLKEFSKQIKSRKATLIILPPAYAETSFNNQRALIDSIEHTMNHHGVAFTSKPARYKFPDTLFFNTNYHLTKRGVDIRTRMVIADLSKTGLIN